MKKNSFFILLIFLVIVKTVFGQSKHGKTSSFTSYRGLVMAGYQGWFNAPGDGAGRRWNHYNSHSKFEPGSANIDIWPDVGEYPKTYKTSFEHADGSYADICSSYDASSTETHFKWLQRYDIDGVFVQRFITDVRKNSKGRNHNDRVLGNAFQYAEKYHRALSVMYDLSGFDEVDEGTAILKASKNPPLGLSSFVTSEENVPSDYYLFLTGLAGKMLRKEIPVPEKIPLPKNSKTSL